MKKILLVVLGLWLSILPGRSDEGMWIPLLLEKLNIQDMQAKGLKLSAEDIYSVNQACLKDAIVIFGRGCTGELVSNEGLLFTNHHCGYGAIQSHSSVEHDYLTDGFWAMNKEEELPNPGLTATFLIRIEDVTDKVLDGVKDKMTEEKRYKIIDKNIEEIEEEAIKGTHYRASTRPFYYGNQYFMFIYEVYRDVRLVGTPPSSIGKFGGDTDNWMWPRHTGDFSVFRIYADKDNKPAEYSEDNVPYQPKKFLSISSKGLNKDDFTFVMGYPGSTEQYLTSYAVDLIQNHSDPRRIELRDSRLQIMKKYMDKSDKVRIQYSSKYAGVANAWKKWQGEIRGLKRLNAIAKKQDVEKDFATWISKDKDRLAKYGNLMDDFKKVYTEYPKVLKAAEYYREAALATEVIDFAYDFDDLAATIQQGNDVAIIAHIEKMKGIAQRFFKNYSVDIDKEIFINLMPEYFENVDAGYHPDFIHEIKTKYSGDFSAYCKYLFENTVFADQAKVDQLLEKESSEILKAILADPAYVVFSQLSGIYGNEVTPLRRSYVDKIHRLQRYYMQALLEMYPDKTFYPDANFTMRVTYGKVDDYEPRDGVQYKYYTTLDGVIEKDNPEIYDYDVPQRLRDLYKAKDFGDYAQNGKMPVCFTASNHTSGGNSGSPVLNANGELIGLNFDRNWEGTMSDIMYDPDQCRNITLDVRYVLFIIDKFAGAGYLLDEMTIVK